MLATLSCLIHMAKTASAGRSVHQLAELDDHTLRDIGLRRTDLYALRDLHASRIKAACCRLRDLAFRLAGGRTPSCC
jgi:hypothetical protein